MRFMQRSRRTVGVLLAVKLWLALFAQAAAGAPPAVAGVGMTVFDLDRSVAFFTEVLDFEPVGERELAGEAFEHLTGVFGARAREATLELGGERLVLTEYLAPRGRAIPPDSRSNDRWFQHVAIVVSDMERVYNRLRAHRVRHVSTGPQRLPDWNPNAGGIEAFYFQDADGHNLEVIAYPPGKGDPRWQAEDRLFLGIDHTAIAVGDTEASLAFDRDVLGLGVAGASENWGSEQERLNQVFGTRLRITALRGAGGPGVEFLEYLAPSNGRPAPSDLAANDLAHWQTTVVVEDLDGLGRRLRAAGGRWVSPGVVSLAGGGSGAVDALLVRDPDGHALELVEP